MVPGMLHSNVLNQVAIVAFGVALVLTSAAQARVFIGFGFPFYIGPPAYYPPPPVAYAPPVPPPAAPSGQSCYVGAYVCPMDRPVASGCACYCLSNDRAHIPGQAG